MIRRGAAASCSFAMRFPKDGGGAQDLMDPLQIAAGALRPRIIGSELVEKFRDHQPRGSRHGALLDEQQCAMTGEARSE